MAGPPTGLLPASDPGLQPFTSDQDAAQATSATTAASEAPKPSPEVTLELPYPSDARPRAPSPLQAAVEDEDLARWNVGGSADPSYVSSQTSYHPGTRVVVDTRFAKHRPGNPVQIAPRHGLTLDGLQAQARSHGYWPFRLCFEAGQREKKGVGGETRVAFSVGPSGKVSRAWLLDSALRSPATAACLVREVHKLSFAPRPARALAMVASIKIWPGDAESLAAPDPPGITPASGDLDREAVRALVGSRLAELGACFSVARERDPALWGRLALTAVLEVDGTVHRISEVESHFPSASAAHCAEALLARLVFPSVNGKPFAVVIPIRLNPPALPPLGSDATPSPEGVARDAGSD